MERDTNQMSQSSALCRSGCGFYGSPATDGLCSKCYKDAVKRKQSTPPSSVTGASSSACGSGTENASQVTHPASDALNTASPTVPAAVPSTSQEGGEKDGTSSQDSPEADSNAVGSNDSLASDSASQDDDPQQKDKKKKNRCNMCKKKVGLTGFPCRCGGLFCSLHRYSNEHNCTFDYKELGAQEIRKNNPLVVGEKIQKI